MCEKKKIRNLGAYIISQYGEDQLGLIRLLSSFSFFRDFAARGDLSKLLGLPMISFEKVLREQHSIYYVRENNRKFKIINGGRSRAYDDDIISSIAGYLVGEIRELFPDLSEFPNTPVVGLGIGSNVDDILSHFDYERLGCILSENREEWIDYIGADAVDSYINAYTMVGEGVNKYKVVNLANKICVKVRKEPPAFIVKEKGDALPFASPEEAGLVMMGAIEKSLKAPPKGFRDKMKEMLLDAHPQGEFDAAGNFVIYESLGDGRDWDRWIPYSLMAYRTTTHSSIGYTPHYLVHGREMELPSDQGSVENKRELRPADSTVTKGKMQASTRQQIFPI